MTRQLKTLLLGVLVVLALLLGCDPPTPIVNQTEPADSVYLDGAAGRMNEARAGATLTVEAK